MKRTWIVRARVAIAMLCVIASSSTMYAQSQPAASNPTITYQGKIERSDGNVLNGDYTFHVTLYADAYGMQPIWSDNISAHITQGVFNCSLGSHHPLPQQQMDKPLWVGVAVDGSEMHPLARLSSSPMAIAVADSSITASKIATDYIASISIDGKKITNRAADINLQSANGIKLGYDEKTNSVLIASDIGGKGKVSPTVVLDPTNPGGNSALGVYDVIGGGQSNTITNTTNPTGGNWNSILGGFTNLINDNATYNSIGGGRNNTVAANMIDATIGGGNTNSVSSYTATVSGGGSNQVAAFSNYGTIGGGYSNTVSGAYATISGGTTNSQDYDYGFIGGGELNDNHAIYSVIGGGKMNSVDDDYSLIGSGHDNLIYYYSTASAIGGGHDNVIKGTNSVIANESFIGGGSLNTILAQNSTIGGGTSNDIENPYGTIGGGRGNRTRGDYGTISGGAENGTNYQYDVIVGGYKNFITNVGYSTVLGGQGNTIYSNPSLFFGGDIIGGDFNNMYFAEYSSLSGGTNNYIGGSNTRTIYGVTIPGGMNLSSIMSDCQTVLGTFNRTQGSYVWGNPVNDDRILIIGNGTDYSSLSNAFEVSYNGHSIVYHNLGANKQVNFGGTYQDNVIYAWAQLDPPNPLPPPNVWVPVMTPTSFGVVNAMFQSPNHYRVTIATENPNGDTPQNLTSGVVTATCIPNLMIPPNSVPTCTQASATSVTGNIFDIWTYENCSPTALSVMTHVTGRP